MYARGVQPWRTQFWTAATIAVLVRINKVVCSFNLKKSSWSFSPRRMLVVGLYGMSKCRVPRHNRYTSVAQEVTE